MPSCPSALQLRDFGQLAACLSLRWSAKKEEAGWWSLPVCLAGLLWGGITSCVPSALETGKCSELQRKTNYFSKFSFSGQALTSLTFVSFFLSLFSLCPTHLCPLPSVLTSLFSDLHLLCFINSKNKRIKMGESPLLLLKVSAKSPLVFLHAYPQVCYSQCLTDGMPYKYSY